MKDFFNLRKSKLLLLTLLAFFVGGVSPAWAEAVTLPYSYDFSTALDTEGWTKERCHSSTGISSGAFRFYYNSNPPQYLISPELSAISSTVDVTFDYWVQSASWPETFQVGYSTTTNAVAEEGVFTWDTEITAENLNSAPKEYKTTFPAGVKYVAIRYNSNGQYYLFIDNFKVCKTPTCITPAGLATSDLTSSSVTLSWTSDADAWNVQYKKVTDADWTDVSGTVSSNPYTLTGLEPATAYQARVRTYCDATDQSDWTDAVSFTTDCATVTIDATHSFSEDFSGSSIPACWGTIDSGSYKWSISSGRASTSYYGPIYLILPPMELSVDSWLTFDNYFGYASDYNGSTNKSSIVISTTGTAAEDFTTTLYTFTKDELPSSSSTGLPKEISLAEYTGQTVYIAFKHEASNGHSWQVDNVVVEKAPSVVKPSGLTASNPTYQGATLSWTAGSDETEWKVIYGETGFDPASEGTTIDNVTENPYTLTGLTPETAYDVYVKAVKGTDVSDVSNKANFTTTVRYPAPTALTATDITTTSATIGWTANGDETKWEITWNTTGTTPDEEGTYTEVSTNTYEITGLETETTYYAFVRSKAGEEHSAWSAACEFTPSANTYLTVNDGTTTNAYVPVYGYFTAAANLGGQFIIPAANLTDLQNKVVKKLTFYSSASEYAYGDAEFDVLIKEVDNATMTSSMYAWDDSWTTVYSGTLAIVGGKMNITFTSDYNYTGSNLLVGIHKTSTDKSGSNYNVTFYGTNAGNGNYRSNYNPNGNRQTFQPKTTIGYQEKTGSELKVFDGETELTESPASFDFGLAAEGDTHTFTLKNTAATPYVAAISSDNLTLDPTEVTPTAEGVTFTVAMPANDITNEPVVITPATESGLDPFIINVSGTLRDTDKEYQNVFTNLPTGWSAEGSWSYSKTNGATTSAWYINQGTLARLKTPLLSIADGEKFIIEAKGNSDGYQHVQLQYSTDGTTWENLGEELTLTSSFKTFTMTSPNTIEAGNYYIGLLASQASIRMFYGGEVVSGPKFAINVAEATTQDFGDVEPNASATKDFTITNDGNQALTVNVTNAADFYVQKTINFTNSKGWSDVYLYAWIGEGDSKIEPLGAWPGEKQTNITVQNEYNQDVYAINVPVGAKIIMNNNSGAQSQDITLDFTQAGIYLDDSNAAQYWGDADASVFNADGQIVVAADGGTTTFTARMVTSKTVGDKSGNIVLGYDDILGADQTFTISCEGYVIDHSKLYITFTGSTEWPTEIMQHGADWNIYNYGTTGYARQTSTSTASSLILTPLTVVDGKPLKFKAAYQNNSYKQLGVRYTTDGGITWADYKWGIETDLRQSISGSFNEFTVENIPAGTAVFEFKGRSVQIDDIIADYAVTTAPLIELTQEGSAVENNSSKDFGNLNAGEQGEITYTLTNNGNAAYEATVTGTDVYVYPASVNIPAGGSATVSVYMPYGDGKESGSMTISSESWVGDITLNYTATLVSADDYVVDFESGRPAGWYLDTWTVTDGAAYIYTGNMKPMITAKFEATEGKNELSFDAKVASGSDDQTLNVYTSNDRKTWSETPQTFTLNGTVQNFKLSALDNGNYYVKFEARNAIIDNIKGVKKVDAPEHDLILVDTTWPTGAVTPGTTYTATVKVASLCADEDVTAELYFGENKVATVGQTISNGTTSTLTLEGNVPAAGTYDVYVKVNGNVNIETEHQSVTVADTRILNITAFTRTSEAEVQADEDNKFSATFSVTVKNNGTANLAANEVSVSIINGTDALETATWTPDAETIYLKAGDYTTGANMAIYRWSTDKDQEWALFTTSGDGIYTASLNGKDNFIICRVNPETAEAELDWGENVYNQSDNLTTTTGNIFDNSGYKGDYNELLNLSQSNTLLSGMSASMTLSVTLSAGEGGDFTFKAKENVSDTEYFMSQSVTVTPYVVFTLNENETYNATTEFHGEVTLNRPFVKGWNTLVLPFDIDAATFAEKFGSDAVLYTFSTYNSNVMNFTKKKENTVEAGTPYLLELKAAVDELTFTDVTVQPGTTAYIHNANSNGVWFYANYASDFDMEGKYEVNADRTVQKDEAGSTLKAFRAYITTTNEEVDTLSISITEDVATGVSRLLTDDELEGLDIYNLQGQRVEKTAKGLLIINGKKVVRK